MRWLRVSMHQQPGQHLPRQKPEENDESTQNAAAGSIEQRQVTQLVAAAEPGPLQLGERLGQGECHGGFHHGTENGNQRVERDAVRPLGHWPAIIIDQNHDDGHKRDNRGHAAQDLQGPARSPACLGLHQQLLGSFGRRERPLLWGWGLWGVEPDVGELISVIFVFHPRGRERIGAGLPIL